ncbi:MAG: Spy/CpxP family protein refolding chaperone [Bacteroidales bacterium]|nr:Spy/CpxP family protein refolding chaperone [Bacteroidales bacterium]
MKNTKMRTNLVMVAALLLSLNLGVMAQQGNGWGNGQGWQKGDFCGNIPDLTEDQQSKIQTLRTAHWKEMQTLRNDLGEKRARLQTLQTADNVNMNEINNVIEEMGTIRTNKQKSAIAHRLDVRNLLTDDQKVYFDSRAGNRGAGMGNKCGFGQGRRNGNRNGQGFGRGYRWNNQ